jgi:YVTN family beta-propeller protein
MNEIPDDEGLRLSERFTAAASKLTPASHSLAEIRGLVQRRLRRRRVTRIATVVGAAAAVVAVVLAVNAVTGPTASHPVVPVQSGTPSPSPTPTTSPSNQPPSALVSPTLQTHPSTGTPSPESSDSGALEASVVKQIPLPSSGADAIAIDSDMAYVAGGGTHGTVSLLDLSTDVVGKTIAVGAAPVAVAVDPVLHTAYVANSGAGTVSVIDTASASVVATVKVGAKPVAIAVDETRHVAYVVNNAANSVSILDETTNTVTGTLPVGPGPVAAALDTTTNTIFVANINGAHGGLTKIDLAVRGVSPMEALPVQPFSLAVDPAQRTLYLENVDTSAGDADAATVWFMDEKTVQTSGSARIASSPASPVASVLDLVAHTLYVVMASNVAGVAGRLLVLPSPDNFLGDAPFVPVGMAPKAVALDPNTHDLYVVNGDNTITLVAGIGSSSPVSGTPTAVRPP